MLVLHDWLLTPERVAVHLPTRTAVVADLHLGYAEARRRCGDAVPSESVTELLGALIRVKEQHAAHYLVVAGDLLEDSDCCDALAAFTEWLTHSGMELLAVVPGNHDLDLDLTIARAHLPLCPQGVEVGGWRIVHGEGTLPEVPVVHGHFHPCLRWSPKNRANRLRFARSLFDLNTIDGPCYLSGPGRLILPAYSQEAAGVNILSKRNWRTLCCHVISGDSVLDLGEVSTLRRKLNTDFRRMIG